MRIKIAARQSDLARLQAQTVGRALLRLNDSHATAPATENQIKKIEVEFQFRASLGDLNLTDPLWKMPEKGVFTEDFLADLIEGQCDLVVHSWKDLPTESRAKTQIVATLPRADARDLLLVRKDRLDQVRANKTLRVLTSSPRRTYNLDKFLKDYLPLAIEKVEFCNVRGNIPTRLRKLFGAATKGVESVKGGNDGVRGSVNDNDNDNDNVNNVQGENADALILAKAALDRLLETNADEYTEVRAELRFLLGQCQWMVLPLSANPTAAAQGALAIEVRKDRHDLMEILSQINCEQTFACVEQERKILSNYGGGCHQKIGVHVLRRPYGDVTYLRGLTDQGEVLNQVQLRKPSRAQELEHRSHQKATPLTSFDNLWPAEGKLESLFFTRQPLPREMWETKLRSARFVWIARENALSPDFSLTPDTVVWCAGLKSWKKLAARGVWVHGSAEGLGEMEPPQVETLCGNKKIVWTKLTHDASLEAEPLRGAQRESQREIHSAASVPRFLVLPTYHLEPKADFPDLSGKSHFFWMSGSSFDLALQHCPQIRFQHHACGPGRTFAHLRATLGPEALIDVYLTPEDWRQELLGKST